MEMDDSIRFDLSPRRGVTKVKLWTKTTVVLMFLVCQKSEVVAGGYVEQYLNNPELCPPVGKLPSIGYLFRETIRLANYPNNTVIVKLSRWQERNPPSAHLNFRCTFDVTAPKNHGIMMTIRSLHLRRFSQQASCIDYLKFKPKRSNALPHVCGDVEQSDKSAEPLGLIGPRFVYDPHSELDVTIVTDEPTPNDAHKPLQIELVFTATKVCSIPSLQSGKVKQCTMKTPNSCIPADLFCDGYINCGIEGDFGDDERECPEKPQAVSRAMSVFIFGMTALGTLVTVAVVVLLICCCCRKFTKKPTTRRSSTDAEQQAELDRDRPRTPPTILPSAQRRSSTPSAPPEFREMPTWRSSTPSPKLDTEDEDLPPSYKDLFPNSGTIKR